MSGFSKFVVTGAGVIGASIISELAVQPNVTITVLTRKESVSGCLSWRNHVNSTE